MTQRIFDVENEKDMADLWDILPDDVEKLSPIMGIRVRISANVDYYSTETNLIAINWHDKTEITRPVNYGDMIGCVGWFWDNDDEEKSLGVLTDYIPKREFSFIKGNNDNTYLNFRPAKKSELKFWEDEE